MKVPKSENVDISFILEQRLIPPKKFEIVSGKTTVVHGLDITIFPMPIFFEKQSLLRSICSAKVNCTYVASKKWSEKTKPATTTHLKGSSNECTIYITLRTMCLFQQPNCIREMRGANNNCYKETILFNNNNHFTLGTIQYISNTSNTSYGSFRLSFLL